MKTCKECGTEKTIGEFYVAYHQNNGKTVYATDCKECSITKSIERNRRNPNRKFIQLKHVYGITKVAYEGLLMSQGGHCAICPKIERLCVDHDHRTGDIRGILCEDCNLGLGRFKDDPELLKKGVEYLCGL